MLATLTLTRSKSTQAASAWPDLAAQAPTLRPHAWDYAASSDAQLIVFARKINDRRAVHELIARHYPWLRGVIGRRARRARLGREDTEDAQQETVFALLEAIVDYNLLESSRAGGCSFRTFLGRRAISRLQNALYRLRWLASRRRDEEALIAALEGSQSRWGSQCRDQDPAVAIQWRELYSLLRQAIARFNEEQQRLLEGSAEGVPLEQLATAAGVSRITIIRQRDQLTTQLREQFKDWLS
jgi:RNA polymerase sigma factor (sigma-70 family)